MYEASDSEWDMDDTNTDYFTVGKKVKIDLADMDYKTWRGELQKDVETLELLTLMVADITPEHDYKLQELLKLISAKIENPINPGNKKVLIFSAFSDTAEYLYEHVSAYIKQKYGLETADITGTIDGKTTIKGFHATLNNVLTCFSTISKGRDVLMPGKTTEIDILIATDCISEGHKYQSDLGGVMMEKDNDVITIDKSFLENVSNVLDKARKNAKTAVNLSMVYAYYEIGKIIVEEEQKGKQRAAYGTQLVNELSVYLTKMYGKGFSVGNLKNIRQFYRVYSTDQIGETVFSQFENLPMIDTGRRFFLSWSHYLKLMRITNIDERHFYEIESVKNDWSLSELKRQYDSSLYERIALSTDKDKVYRLALEGQSFEKPQDVIKDPYVLEFLGLKELPEYSESELESRIIDNLQQFLLELGRGFAFIGRQVRFTFDEEHFMVDLVFYNRLLRCFVLFDLKIGELKHQDIGQMQMYVNYYDRKVKLPDENPTIGIVLCKDKNNAVVEMTLPEDNSQIFASKYETVLPSKEALQKLLEEQMSEEAK